mmetsp:Transcript_4052/g.7850  ORF Transcript_4052/g.7850 Transcript_4052/m.7850 type:complete len:273 (+) Transcript_4052:123-941(+)
MSADTPATSVSTPPSAGNSLGIWLFILSVLSAVGMAFYISQVGVFPSLHMVNQTTLRPSLSRAGLYTAEELAQFDSRNPNQRLLAILGEVFDVTKNSKMYGEGGSYHFFAGVDASKAFVSGEFKDDGLTDDVSELESEDILALEEWRDFYHKEYTYVGKLAGGNFYDMQGEPTEALAAARAKALLASEERAKEKEAEKLVPNCNSRWSQKEGGKIWCTVGYPRKTFVKQRGPDTQFRCACHQNTTFSERHQLYPNCEAEATTCQTSPPPTSG